MKLSKKTTIRVSDTEAIVIGHMTYSAKRLWNVCNHERHNYIALGMETAPNWYTQKKEHKDDLWFKNMPSQTAQEVCKVLDKSWKSFYALVKTGGIDNPRPPRYKQKNIPITYMQNGFQHNGDTLRLTVSKSLRAYMLDKYQIDVHFLYLRNPCFQSIDHIKQLILYPPEHNQMDIIIVYEVPDVELKPDNGRYLSIDLGLHNLMTCYDSTDGSSFIVGRQYLSITRKYDKEIDRVQSQWSAIQVKQGVTNPQSSKHVKALYAKKHTCVTDYLHKVTHWVACYCEERKIHTVVLGDILDTRKDMDEGLVSSHKSHEMPYSFIRKLLEYKLAKRGIRLVLQKETYSSQCSPLAPAVDKSYANKANRVYRGLYRDGDKAWNADVVGAYNILRLYVCGTKQLILPSTSPYVVKVAV